MQEGPRSCCSSPHLYALGELVAHAPYCEQVFWLRGVVFDLFANLAHEHGDAAFVNVAVAAPDVLVDLAARERLSGIRRE